MGSDNDNSGICFESMYFNPRSHMGSDSYRVPYIRRQTISIHAPTWGATAIMHISLFTFHEKVNYLSQLQTYFHKFSEDFMQNCNNKKVRITHDSMFTSYSHHLEYQRILIYGYSFFHTETFYLLSLSVIQIINANTVCLMVNDIIEIFF